LLARATAARTVRDSDPEMAVEAKYLENRVLAAIG
jgi:hypothetical protein